MMEDEAKRICMFGASTDITYDEGTLFLEYPKRQQEISALLTFEVITVLSRIPEIQTKVRAHVEHETSSRVVLLMFDNTLELLRMLRGKEKLEVEVNVRVFFETIEHMCAEIPQSLMLKTFNAMSREEQNKRLVYVVMSDFHAVDTGSVHRPPHVDYAGLTHGVLQVKQ
jgi:hypothetical protein